MTKHVLLCLLLSACQSGGESDPTSSSSTPPLLAMGPSSDFSTIPAARLAFVADQTGFRGGYLTHDVHVGDGAIALTPKSYDPNVRHWVTGSPVGLETDGVWMGDTPLGGAVAQPIAVAPNQVVLARGEIEEHVTNREDGVEQSWVFPTRPEGAGDLTVNVLVSGQTFIVANDHGLHFDSPAGLGVRYSHAAWRDSIGEEWPIAVRFENNRIKITVPEEIVARSTFPATLDPTITGELFVDNPAIGTTGFTSFQNDVAADATQYFVVWADQRDDRSFDIFGARVSSAGAVTDNKGIHINQATGTQQNPVVAAVTGGFVVAWENVVATGNSDIEAAFINGSTGAVTQLGKVAGTAANETLPAIGSRAGEALLVWQSGTDLAGARFSGGAFGAAFTIANSANTEKEPAVAADPAGNYLVTFSETNGTDNVRGQLVTAAGALSGAAFDIAATAGQENQSTVAFDGTNFVVAFSVATDIRAARVGPTGTVLDTTAVVINAGAATQVNSDIACSAGNCSIQWEDTRNLATTNRDIFGASLTTTAGIVVAANDIAVSTQPRIQSGPHLAALGTNYLSVWDDNRNTDTTDVRGTRMTNAGGIVDTTNLVIVTQTSNFGVPTGGPTIAQSTAFTDVYVSDSQIPDSNVVHIRFNSAGTQVDNPPKMVSNAAADQLQPSGATLGTNSLVVWSDSRAATVRHIFAARVTQSNGLVVDANGIQVSNGASDQVVPKVASTGTVALAVWQDRRNANFDIFGALIDSNGTVTMTDIPVCVAAGDDTRPNVAYDSVNNQFLVVWTSSTFDIRGARVSAAGAVLDANCGAVISGAAGSQFSADPACGSGQCMVVWEDRRNDPNLGDIFGSRVTLGAALTVLDPNGIAIAVVAGSSQSAPSVAAAGGYLVAWEDHRNVGTTGSDIFGAQVGTNGVVTSTFAISQDPEDESLPDLVAGSSASNPYSIAYLKKNPALDATRINVRRISLGSGSGQACTADGQCTTGFCRDYKCCNTDCGGGGANGNTGDCQACSIAHHGSTDGTCTTIAASPAYVCRLYADPFCDRSEVCDGVSLTCPADSGQHQGLVCNAGTGAVCPPNAPPGPHLCP